MDLIYFGRTNRLNPRKEVTIKMTSFLRLSIALPDIKLSRESDRKNPVSCSGQDHITLQLLAGRRGTTDPFMK